MEVKTAQPIVSSSANIKLICSRETLLNPLQLIIGVVERKQMLPILSNVRINIGPKQLSITGTDLEVELIGNYPLETENMPTSLTAITLPGRKLMDICKALPEGAEINLSSEKDRMLLKSGRSRFTLSTLPAEDFPDFQTQNEQLSFQISQKDLLLLIQRTYFSMAQQDVRYYLNGLLLELTTGKLRAVATDGHRL